MRGIIREDKLSGVKEGETILLLELNSLIVLLLSLLNSFFRLGREEGGGRGEEEEEREEGLESLEKDKDRRLLL